MKKTALMLLLIWICAVSSIHAQTFNLQTGREPIASLDGLWRFHTGDNPAWANPNFDDSHWPLLRSDESWAKQGYLPYGGYEWYRFTLQVPDGSKPLALLLTRIGTGYQVYENGVLIGSAGSTARTRSASLNYSSKIFQLSPGSAGPQAIQIALRVWSYMPFTTWIGRTPATPGSAAGDPTLLAWHLDLTRDAYALTFVNSYAFALLAALVGLTMLVLFLLRTTDRENLWFFVLLFAAAAGTTLEIRINIASIPYPLYWLLESTTDSLSMIAALVFFSIVLDVRRSFLWWTTFIAAAAMSLTAVPLYAQWPGALTGLEIADILQVCLRLPALVWIVATLAIRALKKDTSARLLLAPAALFYGFGILNNILFLTWFVGWQRKSLSLDVPLLSHLFPLNVGDVINYIFVLALLIFLVRRFALSRQEETRLSNEFEAARGIQSLLVPAMLPNTPGFTVESVYIPASEVGGDFFQVQPGEDGSVLIVVGDVSGKGLKAAMTVSTIVGALRNESSRQPTEVLVRLNRVLHGQVSGFVTCCATLITSDGAMTIANAGHLSPYRNGEEMAVAGGLPLGILAEGSYEETEYQLAVVDRLTFMSDGVVEATNEKRELFGFERTQQISIQPAAAIADTAKAFGQQDDITVVTVTRTANLEVAIA